MATKDCGCGGKPRWRDTIKTGVESNMQNVRQSGSGNVERAVAAGSKTWYEVWRNGVYAGRRSESLVVAQDIARRMGGEVRTAS